MIYKEPGEKLMYENAAYIVGGRVLANEASEYDGLFGRILEIRTDDDRETEMIRRTSIVPLIRRLFLSPALRWSTPFLNSMIRQSAWKSWGWIWSSWRLRC